MKSFAALLLAAGAVFAQPEVKEPVCTTANGEKLPKPGSKLTTEVKDGERTIAVPLGMAYVPAGESPSAPVPQRRR